MGGIFHYYQTPRFREIAFLLWPLLFLKLASERATLRALKELEPRDILEIGGGWGKFTRRIGLLLPNARIVSVDSEERMIRVASRHNRLRNLRFETGDFYEIDKRAECVLLFGLFVLLWPREKALARLRDMSQKVALVTLTGSTWFTRALVLFHRLTTGMSIHLVEPEEFSALARGAGFSVRIIPIHPFERSYLAVLEKRG